MEDYIPFCIYEECECTDCDMCNPSPVQLWNEKLKKHDIDTNYPEHDTEEIKN